MCQPNVHTFNIRDFFIPNFYSFITIIMCHSLPIRLTFSPWTQIKFGTVFEREYLGIRKTRSQREKQDLYCVR